MSLACFATPTWIVSVQEQRLYQRVGCWLHQLKAIESVPSKMASSRNLQLGRLGVRLLRGGLGASRSVQRSIVDRWIGDRMALRRLRWAAGGAFFTRRRRRHHQHEIKETRRSHSLLRVLVAPSYVADKLSK
jgi:hypothetical protein